MGDKDKVVKPETKEIRNGTFYNDMINEYVLFEDDILGYVNCFGTGKTEDFNIDLYKKGPGGIEEISNWDKEVLIPMCLAVRIVTMDELELRMQLLESRKQCEIIIDDPKKFLNSVTREDAMAFIEVTKRLLEEAGWRNGIDPIIGVDEDFTPVIELHDDESTMEHAKTLLKSGSFSIIRKEKFDTEMFKAMTEKEKQKVCDRIFAESVLLRNGMIGEVTDYKLDGDIVVILCVNPKSGAGFEEGKNWKSDVHILIGDIKRIIPTEEYELMKSFEIMRADPVKFFNSVVKREDIIEFMGAIEMILEEAKSDPKGFSEDFTSIIELHDGADAVALAVEKLGEQKVKSEDAVSSAIEKMCERKEKVTGFDIENLRDPKKFLNTVDDICDTGDTGDTGSKDIVE